MSKIKCNCHCHQLGSQIAHIKSCVDGYIEMPDSDKDTPASNVGEIGEKWGMPDWIKRWTAQWLHKMECQGVDPRVMEGFEKEIDWLFHKIVEGKDAALPSEAPAAGEVPTDVMEWIRQQIDFFSVPSAKIAGKAMAIDMYYKMQEDKDFRYELFKQCFSQYSDEISQMKASLAESRNDTAVFKEWWDQSRVDISTLTGQRDANAQQALSYMEELTKAQTALVKIGMLTNGVFEKGEEEVIKKS